MTKTERQKIIKKLDDIYSKYIRERDNYTCFICNKQGREKDGVMQCGHVLSRIAYSTRWACENAVCLCNGCNFEQEFRPEKMINKYIATFGMTQWELLNYKNKQTKSYYNYELEALHDLYLEKLINLKKEKGNYYGSKETSEY